ncbi:hypothetical protein C7I84_21245 [Mesorhizobium ephedrae]|uniref:Uncharacterized protein n=1 Tax=Kumtagia ephedrae TaxID=2116701 RepID=A0A2P7S1T8_9HYPH|nr:hypothetical protein C7I84_21245 [Mesorhizobium ephedrae]
MQAPRRGEVEHRRIAADFEQDGLEGIETRGLLGDPQHVGELFGFGDEKVFRRQAETCGQPRRIGPARLPEDVRRADPEQGPDALLLRQQAHERQRETGGRAGIAAGMAVDFGKAAGGKSAAEGRIQALHADGEHVLAACGIQLLRSRLLPLVEAFGQTSLDLRDLMAQGANEILRHGMRCHDDKLPTDIVPVMF